MTYPATLAFLVVVSVLGAAPLAHADPARDVACDPDDLTLAIREANAAGGGTLSLAAGCTYTIADPCLPEASGGRCTWEDLGFLMGPNGLPAITSDITILGHGATIARDPAAPDFRLFVVAGPFTVAGPDALGQDAPATGALTLLDLTLANGKAVGGRGGDGVVAGGGGGGLGGCLFVAGALTLDHATLEGCQAIGGAPGQSKAYSASPANGGGGGLGGAGGSAAGGGGGGGMVGTGGGGPSAGGGGAAGHGANVVGFGNAGGGGGTTGDGSGPTGGASELAAPWGVGADPSAAGGPGGGGGGCLPADRVGGAGGFGGGGASCEPGVRVDAAGGAGGFGGGGGSGPVFHDTQRSSIGGAGGFGGGGGGGNNVAGAAGFAGGQSGGFDGVVPASRGQGLGGAIFVTGTLAVTRTTITGCSAQDVGGAIFAHGGDGAGLGPAVSATGTLTNSTFAYNEAPVGSQVATLNAVLTFTSDILAGSSACSVSPLHESGTVISGGANVVTDPGDCTFEAEGDQVLGGTPTAIGLHPLADYGGLVQTLPPLRTSAARGAGHCEDATDARGIPVPATECDAGAVQLEDALALDVPCDVGALTDAVRQTARVAKATLRLAAGCTYTIAEPCTPTRAPGRCRWADLGFFMGPTGLPLIQSDVTIEGHGATIARAAGSDTGPDIAPFRLFTVAGPFTEIARQHWDPTAASPGYPEPGSLTLRDVRLSHGFARGGHGGDSLHGPGGGGGAGLGGCIFAAGALTLERATLDGCVAEGGAVGAENAEAILYGGGGGLGGDAGPLAPSGGGGFMGSGDGGGGGAAGNGGYLSGADDDPIAGGGGGTTGDALFGSVPGGSELGPPWAGGGDGVGGGGVAYRNPPDGQRAGFGGGGGSANSLTPGAGGFGGGGGGGVGRAAAGGFGGGGSPPGFGGGDHAPGQGLGGAVFTTASLVVTRSTLSGNVARAPGGVGIGGAIFAYAGTPLSGGAIPGASVVITSSTLAGNDATSASGLAIWDGSAATVTSSALDDAAGCAVNGAGAFASGGANAVSDLGELPDLGDVGDLAGCVFDGAGDQVGTPASPLDLQLGALGDQGGPTPTHAPGDASPLLGRGRCDDAGDQRGVALLSAPACDVGAVERTRIGVTVTIAGSGGGTVSSDSGDVACPGACATGPTLRETLTLSATSDAGSVFDGFTGDCAGTDCVLAAAGSFHVTATFSRSSGSGDVDGDATVGDAEADAGATVEDATVEDATVEDADAGPTLEDADAGATAEDADAGATVGDADADAGAHGKADASGCGAGAAEGSLAPLVVALALAARRRRPRRQR